MERNVFDERPELDDDLTPPNIFTGMHVAPPQLRDNNDRINRAILRDNALDELEDEVQEHAVNGENVGHVVVVQHVAVVQHAVDVEDVVVGPAVDAEHVVVRLSNFSSSGLSFPNGNNLPGSYSGYYSDNDHSI